MNNSLVYQTIREKLDYNAFLLFFCGLCALYWELLLIRWLSTCVRAIAYYSNFVLIAAFFGLGTGALISRYRIRLHRLVFPALSLAILIGFFLSGFFHFNFQTADEYVWIGAPLGITFASSMKVLPVSLIILVVYTITAGVFIIFGQWLGILFRTHTPLWAYSVEVFGSIVGILLFAFLSAKEYSPVVWFIIGFVLLLLIIDKRKIHYVIALACSVTVLATLIPYVKGFTWSPYYRIYVEPLKTVFDKTINRQVTFEEPVGYTVTVNNDYHQMLLDLRSRTKEHEFLQMWRTLYDFPYKSINDLPKGPILVVGAGTGNDVSAALRNTDRQVYAVEIDPAIIRLGKKLHFETPYNNSRVMLVNDDARAFFHRTNEKFALVVFGFLDSHTLLSSFSSIRLDNFVYTRESFEQVKKILLPRGKVYLTFASNRDWIHERFHNMLDGVFDYPTQSFRHGDYANGITYVNGVAERPMDLLARKELTEANLLDATDDWPFLYLRRPTIPQYYHTFIGVALLFGVLSLIFLPKGERRIRLPYFFLGAAFFLLETSNIVSLSLLYGSTWEVNVMVFNGILVLVLLGNLTSYMIKKPRMNILIVLLAINIIVAYLTPTYSLFSIESSVLRFIAAMAVFLGPIYFASLIFASLIKKEKNFYQAYGSNILGAVIGGVCEYFSLMFGFKFLLCFTLLFYLGVYLLLIQDSRLQARSI